MSRSSKFFCFFSAFSTFRRAESRRTPCTCDPAQTIASRTRHTLYYTAEKYIATRK